MAGDKNEQETNDAVGSSDLVGMIPVRPDEWAYMVRCTAAIEWLEKQGVAWNGADVTVPYWNIGEGTEWLYDHLLDEIDIHRDDKEMAEWRRKNL